MNKEIVKLKEVEVCFNNTPILKNISFSIYKNDFIAIIGPNGGGKTTLLKVILGLIKPKKGEVKIFGKTPQKGRKLIGYLPQHTFFDRNFPISVFDVVLLGRYNGILKNYSKEDKKAVVKALKAVNMLEFKNRQIGKLSGGELQRILLARAIVRNPKLLLLDEPTTGIDPEMQKSFYDLLLKLNKKMAIVLVTHDISVVLAYVKKIACLNRKLFYFGPKEEGLKKLEKMYKYPIERIL